MFGHGAKYTPVPYIPLQAPPWSCRWEGCAVPSLYPWSCPPPRSHPPTCPLVPSLLPLLPVCPSLSSIVTVLLMDNIVIRSVAGNPVDDEHQLFRSLSWGGGWSCWGILWWWWWWWGGGLPLMVLLCTASTHCSSIKSRLPVAGHQSKTQCFGFLQLQQFLFLSGWKLILTRHK